MGERRYAIRLSGVGSDDQHCGRMLVHYCKMLSNPGAGAKYEDGKLGYDEVFPDAESATGGSALLIGYRSDDGFAVSPYQGVSSLVGSGINEYSIYRREYQVYQRPGMRVCGTLRDGVFYDAKSEPIDPGSYPSSALYVDYGTNVAYQWKDGGYQVVDEAIRVYKGEWEPVSVSSSATKLRDFNVTAGRSYQYIMYPKDTSSGLTQIFANHEGTIWEESDQYPGQGRIIEKGDDDTAPYNGSPVSTQRWNEWSLIELVPQDTDLATPTIKKEYKANLDQLWLFKYSLETGAQTQNVSRSEFQTLGQYPRVGYGKSDYASGEVSALLGSEIIPYWKGGYVERLRGARVAPLSTNERAKMLAQWRALVSSKNPKLLRDMKGQSWIVQIFSSSNTPKNFYRNQPDTISFSWKQIGDPAGAVITSDYGDPAEISSEGGAEWTPFFTVRGA